MLWPLQMMTRFVDVGKVVRSVAGWGKGGVRSKRMLIVAGEKDVLMGVDLMRRMAAEYRDAVKKGWSALVGETETAARAVSGDEHGVGFEVVMGSGHHLQNDLYWEDCAEKILAFVEQL